MTNDKNQDEVKRLPEDYFGDRVKDKRKEYDLSVEDLASLTAQYDPNLGDGVSPSTIYRYEGGRSKPGIREVRLLSLALNVSPCWLITGEQWDTEITHNAKVAHAVFNLFAMVNNGDLLFRNPTSMRDFAHSNNLSEIKMGGADNLYQSPDDESD